MGNGRKAGRISVDVSFRDPQQNPSLRLRAEFRHDARVAVHTA